MPRTKYVRALFPGRFQPPHLGHGETIKWILNNVSNEVIVAIGSAQESHTFQNPLTGGERIVAVKLMLQDLGIDISKVYIIPIPDIFMNKVWPKFVEALVPSFDVVVTRNRLVKLLFEENGYKVIEQPLYNREVYMGTIIRQLVVEGKNWREYVTKSVAMYLDEIGFENRLKILLSGE